jgi:xylan 1,4-beta-xylosidase
MELERPLDTQKHKSILDKLVALKRPLDQSRVIMNPIIKGFNPDPCICRAGNDFYIATSTFEWWPGVQIHHSKDLLNWRLLTRPLDRISQLDMRGVEHSAGIWAPALSHADGQFWLIYTNVLNAGGPWKDTPNYLVTAKDITGPWSEPIWLNSSGFDPSLFHDDDGRKWLVNMIWDGRHCDARGLQWKKFAGILLQEYDHKAQKLIGPVKNIWTGSEIGKTEGPHLVKRNGWYYLITAEGGTGESHAISVARSESIWGPYELHPGNPMLTASGKPNSPLTRAGHGSFVETPGGEWYVTHLASRPVKCPEGKNRAIMGRETCIQKFVWSLDGWPRLEDGTSDVKAEVPAPKLPLHPWPKDVTRDDFDGPNLNIHWQTLREPLPEKYCSLKERKGWLRLAGGNSLYSRYDQSLLGRRIQSVNCEVETCMDFKPWNIQQMAGLMCYYDRGAYFYLHVVNDDDLNPRLSVIRQDKNDYHELLDARVSVTGMDKLYLKGRIDGPKLQFSWSKDGQGWQLIGLALEAWKISDGYGIGQFTGGFWTISCQDMSGELAPAYFDYFDYREF